MRFCEQLNEYITRLDCRGKELAEAAGLSAPMRTEGNNPCLENRSRR